ncbi:exosortase-associated protein EpsI, V-type [Parafrankia sp. BMG5.11]|uniref:exosortase-associated protein EpsI, V-type n=1 Tax=Parafrankia sp. BMG5.11 TaxID=222540 RepID=UPI00103CC3FD|nr:exosortase-associated protein EpsI, V-type [Parafrankia sp. BMG5.11]TCJ34973.1 EpsI family protein [Parafrankia sp. BMG5.11]
MIEKPSHVLLGRRHFLIGGALAVASGVAFARQPKPTFPRIPTEKFQEWVPTKFGPWSKVGSSGVVLPPPDSLSDRLYDNLVTGTYEAPGQPLVMLLLAYNNVQDGVVQVHRPEVCYPVGGYQLSETREFDLDLRGRSIPANIFTAVGPERTEQVIYFTRLGSAFPRSWAEQRLAVAKDNLAGRIPDGMMMRVSVLGADQKAAHADLSRFSEQFVGAVPRQLLRLLLGGT